MASKLKEVLPSILSKEQGAFLKGRCIIDGVLYANDGLQTEIRQVGVICKLDLEKAHDHLD